MRKHSSSYFFLFFAISISLNALAADAGQEQATAEVEITLQDYLLTAVAWANEVELNDNPVDQQSSRNTEDVTIDLNDSAPLIAWLGDDVSRIAVWLQEAGPDTALVAVDKHSFYTDTLIDPAITDADTIEDAYQSEYVLSVRDYDALNHIGEILVALIDLQPEQAMQIVRQTKHSEMRNVLAYRTLSAWSKDSPNDALAWMQSAGDNWLNDFAGDAIQVLLEQDPDVALEMIRSLPDSNSKPWWYTDYALFMAADNPQKAMAFALGHPNPSTGKQILNIVAGNWAYHNPDNYLEYLDSLDPATRDHLLLETGSVVAYEKAENPQAALEWANSLSGVSRDRALQSTMMRWFQESPRDALLNYTTVLNESEQTQFIQAIAYELPGYDLEMAKKMFDSSDAQTQSIMSHALAMQMHRQSASSASAWVESLPTGSPKEIAKLALIESISQSDPASAWLQMKLYSGDNQQQDTHISDNTQQMVRTILWNAVWLDPQSIDAWGHRFSLSPSEQSILEEIISNRDDPNYGHGC